MCILFFHFSPNSASAYRFILAANRDEYYARPTKPADFWENNRNILSGLDLEKGKEGGTWLGISRKGKCAALTNYLQPNTNIDALGRGHLVSDFLTEDLDGLTYLKKISLEGHAYNGFNLLTVDFSNTKADMMCYYGNKGDQEPRALDPGIYGLCNSLLDTSWQKLVNGKKLFTEAINKSCGLPPENLVNELMNVINNEEFQLPATDIEQQGQDYIRPILKEFSALFVRTSLYGTRSNTVILVDAKGHVTFTERCLLKPETNQWKVSSYQFEFET
ncbi:transport and Golgi organization protein 2 homolog [Leucoraja erinacea]|uniref:transport and Golgi organization protein 2 homolog n=1 Tax=Leucoraja erinaceus TaxID=7782 RepID=UPI002454407E|nr:transport and Golgi organization protein 2 homolog [Leucoraja erinacea]XP_055511424.1 transport and Golgi organization protein 2 homolog [Leucoraja erinacea]XP_055511425.1 transport and Golgi organization protein 2 homolog [Leucoraja erinacea]XP_055511426.1 transport and Golgi organization protein 2 homolog [Leucoraja erinacea]